MKPGSPLDQRENSNQTKAISTAKLLQSMFVETDIDKEGCYTTLHIYIGNISLITTKQISLIMMSTQTNWLQTD